MQLDHVFGALSDATRRAIVMRLCDGEASVGELAQPFEMALPSLMKHIRILESSGIVTWKDLDLPPVPAGTPVDYRRDGAGVDPLLIWLVLGIAIVAGLVTTVRAVRLR